MPAQDAPQSIFADFNQDCTCVCLAHSGGISVFSLETNKVVFASLIGAVRLCQMLFSTSLLAYVGSGDQAQLTPRKLSLLNTTTHSVIQDLNFPTSVLAVKLNRKRLVAVLKQKTMIYALESLDHLCTVDTSDNPKGVCALTSSSEPCYLAVPSHAETGSIRVYDAAEGSNVLAELEAHKSPLAALKWNHDGSLLASASDRGTVLRVHCFPQATKAYSFRRGSSHACIHCLAFSAAGVDPPLLACTSSHGTVHLWVLNGTTAGPSASILAAVIPASMTEMMEPQRSAVSLRVPAGSPSACAIQKRNSGAGSQDLERSDSTTEGVVTLFIATDAAVLYTYHIYNLGTTTAPFCALEDECYLLPRS